MQDEITKVQSDILKSIDELESKFLTEIGRLREAIASGFTVTPETEETFVVCKSFTKYPFGEMDVMTSWILPDSFDRKKAIEACRKYRKRYGKRFQVEGRKFTRIE